MTTTISFTIERKSLTNDLTIEFGSEELFSDRHVETINLWIGHYEGNIIFDFRIPKNLSFKSNITAYSRDFGCLMTYIDIIYINSSQKMCFLELYKQNVDILCINRCGNPVLQNGKPTHLSLKIEFDYSENTIAYVDFKTSCIRFGRTCHMSLGVASKRRDIMEIPEIIDIINLILVTSLSYQPNDVFDVLGKKIRNGKVIDVDEIIGQIKGSLDNLSIDQLMQIDEWVKSAK